jgi:hypothetical protein
MKIQQLNHAKLAKFSTRAVVQATWLGARKFTASIDEKRVTASAKEVFAQIKKMGASSEVLQTFRATELKTQDKREFCKQLNCFQKIYYLIVKKWRGLDFKDTWEDKFYQPTNYAVINWIAAFLKIPCVENLPWDP